MNDLSPGLRHAAFVMDEQALMIDATMLDLKRDTLEYKILAATAEYCRNNAKLFRQEAGK